jgi:hypothetical protein
VGFAGEIDEPVMELKDPESHGESNPAAAGLCGVEEREDFLARLRGNAYTLVGDFEVQVMTIGLWLNFKLPS